MYKEYRANTLCGAVSQMYTEMAGRHSAVANTIQVIRTSIVANADLKRKTTIQLVDEDIKFPKTDNRKRAPTRAVASRFKANRPTLI